MHSFLITLLALTASVIASFPGIPDCAGSCLGSSYGSCQDFDVKCICSDNSFLAGLSCCVSQRCSAADQETTIQFANAFCQGYGVTNLPQTATCTGTQAATLSSGTATGSPTVPASLSSALAAAGAAATTSAGSGASKAEGAGAGLGLAMAGMLALL